MFFYTGLHKHTHTYTLGTTKVRAVKYVKCDLELKTQEGLTFM